MEQQLQQLHLQEEQLRLQHRTARDELRKEFSRREWELEQQLRRDL